MSQQSLYQSFRNAFSGLSILLKTQRNARIHLAATIAVIAAGLYVQLTPNEWRWVCLAISLVWIIETLNTALEITCDAITEEHHPLIKTAKDLGAAATLIASVFAAMIGWMIFI